MNNFECYFLFRGLRLRDVKTWYAEGDLSMLAMLWVIAALQTFPIVLALHSSSLLERERPQEGRVLD